MKKQIEIRGYEQGKIEGIQKAIEMIDEITKVEDRFENKRKSKTGYYYKLKELIQKLNQEKEK